MITVTKSQGTIELLLDDTDIYAWMEAFITDRKAQHLSSGTISFYNKKFKLFNDYRASLGVNSIRDITPQLLRDFLIFLEVKGHNPGGQHAAYRALKAFLHWWEEEFEPENWQNPFKKIKAPKVPQKLLEPADVDTIKALLSTCNQDTFNHKRDKAIIFTLMDTGVRANELINMYLEDIDLLTGEIQIKHGKGGKVRSVFLGKQTRKSLRSYLKYRQDKSPALWVSKQGDRITYTALRGILRRRAMKANIQEPTLHSFRRFFALQMLRNGVDVFSLQKLMGHADLQILRRYLNQSNKDLINAYQLGCPVENIFKK